jgi:hypothetical protein
MICHEPEKHGLALVHYASLNRAAELEIGKVLAP